MKEEMIKEIKMTEFYLPSSEDNISLYVRNKRLDTMTQFTDENVVLMVHGASYPAEVFFFFFSFSFFISFHISFFLFFY